MVVSWKRLLNKGARRDFGKIKNIPSRDRLQTGWDSQMDIRPEEKVVEFLTQIYLTKNMHFIAQARNASTWLSEQVLTQSSRTFTNVFTNSYTLTEPRNYVIDRMTEVTNN